MHDRRRIRALFEAGARPDVIAALVGCSRSSVYRAVAEGAALDYRRPTLYDRFGADVDALLADYPRMDAVALAFQSGWPGSLRQLEREVARRRPMMLSASKGTPIRPLKAWMWR